MPRRPARLTREEHLDVAKRIKTIKRDLHALGHFLSGKVKASKIDQVLTVGRRLDTVRSGFDDDWCHLTDERSPYYGGDDDQ